MGRKYTIEEIKEIIEKEGCKLLSTEYVNNKTPLLIQCACGEVFEKTFTNFKNQKQKQCPKCSNKERTEKLTSDYSDVKAFIEGKEGNGCKLLSTEYKNARTKLKIQCACGEEFEVVFHTFKNGQKQCPECGRKKSIEKHKKQVTFNCEYCGKEYSRTKSYFEEREHHFCSKECRYKWQENQVTFNCDYCGKECSVNKSKFDRCEHHFCSRECCDKFHRTQVTFNCEYCGKECSVTKSYFEGREHHFCSKECHDKWKKGENNPSWNPNITDEERNKGRLIEGYTEWRKAVYERDNYTCQCCGKHGGSLNAHHLNSYHWDKEHRTDINNALTLCENCHKEFHKIYGKRNNTITQFREFLFNKYTQSQDLKYLALIETIDLTTRAF